MRIKLNVQTKKIIIDYIKKKLELKKEQLKYFEMPLDENSVKDLRKYEELIMKNKVWTLEELIQEIEAM